MAKNTPAIIGYGPFDKALIQGFAANKSAEEVSRMEPINGTLSPAQCLDRLNKLLASKDVLDVQQKRALLVDNAYDLLAKLKKQIETSDYIAPDVANSYMKTVKDLMDMLDRSNAQIEEAMLKFTQRRAMEFTAALTYIFDAALAALVQRHPELSVEEAQEVIYEAIPESLPEVVQ